MEACESHNLRSRFLKSLEVIFMRLSWRVYFCAALLLPLFCLTCHAQQQMASLRPGGGLAWQRTSPTIQQPDGPVLYQLIFNASGVPGTVPVFDTNPRHLASSPIAISSGNVVIGGGSALNINGSSGIITFAPGQTFPASGLPNLTGEVTGPPGATVVSNADPNNTANAIVRRDGSGNFAAGSISVNGALDIPITASFSVGVITMAGNPVLHFLGSFTNTFVGIGAAGSFTTTGIENTGVGYYTLRSNTTGAQNVAIGANALNQNTTGISNSALGFNSLYSNTTGASNSAFGALALAANGTGGNNSAFGFRALAANTGDANSAFGSGALNNNEASNNSAFGFKALGVNYTGSGNAAFGWSALAANTTSDNSAFGYGALAANTTAGGNAAFGWSALATNTTGASNSAFGYNALNANTTAAENSAFGNSALAANTSSLNSAFGSAALFVNSAGDQNSAFGAHALLLNSSGFNNAAFGFSALSSLTSGGFNIAIGSGAGANLQNGSHNIYIGNNGNSNESNTIYIGQQGLHGPTFIGGIYGATSASGATVFVNSSGQLGTFTSSRRYKQDIADLGGESDVLMKLRPVAFYYKPQLDETHTRQYGLVAEEVAKIAPGLVIFDKDGQPQTVRYHLVNAMLLNEVQKQQRQIEIHQRANESQQKQLVAQQQQIEVLQRQLRAMMVRLEVVEALSQAQARTSQIAAAR